MLRVSHQPNSLAALNILLPHLVLDEVADDVETRTASRPVIIFCMVDYDDAGDTRFRTPVLCPSPQQLRALPSAVPKALHRTVAAAVPTPATHVIKTWHEATLGAVELWAAWLRRAGIPVNSHKDVMAVALEYLKQLSSCMSSASSLVEANAYSIAWLLTHMWHLDVLFVYERSLWAHVGEDLTRLVDLAISTDTSREYRIGVWVLCECCSKRCDGVVKRAHMGMSVTWRCSTCDHHPRRDYLDWSANASVGGELPRFVPKVGLSDLADISLYGFDGAAGYAGGIQHVLRSRRWPSICLQQSQFALPAELAADPLYALTSRSSAETLVEAHGGDLQIMDTVQKARLPAVFYAALVPGGDVAGRRRQLQNTPLSVDRPLVDVTRRSMVR